jgi:hypothetical protein
VDRAIGKTLGKTQIPKAKTQIQAPNPDRDYLLFTDRPSGQRIAIRQLDSVHWELDFGASLDFWDLDLGFGFLGLDFDCDQLLA